MYLYEDEEMPTVEQQIDELIAELEAAEDSGNSIRIRYWTDELGGVVYANIVPVDEDGDALEESPLTYSRLTLNDKVAHTVSFVDGYQTGTMEAVIGANSLRLRISGDEDGEPIMSMLLDINASVAENNIKTAVFFELSVYDAGDDMIIRIDYEDDTELNGVDFVSDIKASVSINGMKIMTIFADMYSADPLPSIKDGNAIRLATLTDAEFANWFAGVMNTVQSWPVTLLMSMPPEVLQMMMQNGM